MIEWIVDGTSYPLDGKTPFYLLEHEGMLTYPLHRISERGHLQNGETDRGYRLDPRIITILVAINGTDREDFYQKRHYLAKMFQPRETSGQLRWTLDSTRQIDCHLLELREGQRSYLFQKFSIVLKASDPRWYDPNLVYINYNLGGGDDIMEIPLEIPFIIGLSTLDQSKVIHYSGDMKSYPTIELTGPLTNPVITNLDTGKKLDFTGTTLTGTYTIDLGYADNTITDETGENKVPELTTDSDLVEFCIDPTYGTTNTIKVEGTGATQDTKIVIKYHNYYIGV
jgi:hypothetical protein